MRSTLPIALRVALESDIPFLEGLRRTTMRSLIENHYAWQEQAQRERVLLHFECARIITVEGRDIGLLKVVPEAGEVHLSQIQILPAFQGRGIARALIKGLQKATFATGQPITLHVLRSNPAIKLYRSLGFVVYREDEHFFFMKCSQA